jgi:thiol-disulfide isomerase/thioredoxin
MRLLFIFSYFLIISKEVSCQIIPVDSVISSNSIVEYKNQNLILIDFWATWCAPCMPATKQLEILQETYADDIFIVSISDESNYKINSFLKVKPIRLMVLSDYKETIFNKYRVQARPYCVLLNKEGQKLWEGKPGDLTESILKKWINSEKGRKIINKKLEDIVGQNLLKKQIQPNEYVDSDTAFTAVFIDKPNLANYSFYGTVKSFISTYKSIPNILIEDNEFSKLKVMVNFPSKIMASRSKENLADSALARLKIKLHSYTTTLLVNEMLLTNETMLWDTSQINWEGEASNFLIGDVSIEANDVNLKRLSLELSNIKKELFIYSGTNTKQYDFSFVYTNDQLMRDDFKNNFGIKIVSKVREVNGYKPILYFE